MELDRFVRRIARYVLDAKQGVSGIGRARREFLALLCHDKQQLCDRSTLKFKRILRHAYDTTAYYRRVFKNAGLAPDDIKQDCDISALPLLTRDVLIENSPDLISAAYAKGSLIRSFTGGTTGTHVSFYRDRECQVTRSGHREAILELCGYRIGDRCGLVWGAHADLGSSEGRLNLKERLRAFAHGTETLSCEVLTPEKLDAYYRRLIRFQPTVLYGYPNALTYFAEFIEANRLPPVRPKTIICTAERLTDRHRRKLNQVFGGEVFNIYGSREHGFIAFECRKHRGLHIDIDSVFVEIVHNGKRVEPGSPGDIVITDLCNFGMPFIRHRLGDRGCFSLDACDCGLPLPLLKTIDGRVTDAVYRRDGTRVDGCILTDLFLDIKAIRAMQIVQETLEGIELKLVVTPEYSEAIERRVLEEVRQYMGSESTVTIRIVPDIPRNPNSGKYQEVICRVKPEGVTR